LFELAAAGSNIMHQQLLISFHKENSLLEKIPSWIPEEPPPIE